MTLKWSKAGIAAVALLVMPFAAQAADMPVKAPIYKSMPRSVMAYYNWSGFYAGINAGYGWGTSNWDSGALAGPISISPKGWLFGLTLGYNWQSGSIVYGVEGDIDWSNVKGSAACLAFTCETKNTYMTTFRGRVGYAMDRFLPYLTAGLAYGDIKASTTNPLFPGATKSKMGWTLGGGLEYAFMSNWTAKLEYLYVDLGKFDCGTSCSLIIPDNVSFKESILRVGLNYKFSGPLYTRF